MPCLLAAERDLNGLLLVVALDHDWDRVAWRVLMEGRDEVLDLVHVLAVDRDDHVTRLDARLLRGSARLNLEDDQAVIGLDAVLLCDLGRERAVADAKEGVLDWLAGDEIVSDVRDGGGWDREADRDGRLGRRD